MLLKELNITPNINSHVQAEAVIDPNPNVFKSYYVKVVLNHSGVFEVDEDAPYNSCTEKEIEKAIQYGKMLIESGISSFKNIDAELRCVDYNMTPSEFKEHTLYNEALLEFSNHIIHHARKEGQYKQQLKDYVAGFLKANKLTEKTQEQMESDVLKMFKQMHGETPESWMEILNEKKTS